MRIVRPATINDAQLISSNVPENDYASYDAATTYALGNRVIYVIADTHWIIESLQNSNTGHTPTGASTDTWWLLVGKTNRWKMFDQSVQSQTVQAGSMSVTLSTASRVDTVALLNVSAASVHITMTDSIDGVVYDQTFVMSSRAGITDSYSYFFEPIVRKTDLVVSGLPPYAGADITITLTEPGGNVACGVCIIGLSRNIGGTQYGAQVGIQDYSLKQKNSYGDYSILERAYNKYAKVTVQIESGLVDQIETILAGYRATPILYIGSDDYGSTAIYGFYKDFYLTIAYSTMSICTLELEGMT